ncbi:glycoside hydrolase family 88 protein [Sphingomonas psychrotolerans]|uniref:Glycoside hydrolase family 88 protein n=1 Tax=Sphingomonas psychrotolerans TaxID=1327635 RepID=A0ABU3N9J8_9SPHN|nr:glycoside hydrolase family 88 protein [Sphingomonas psychrotolerans]MDT8761078.1 glycoside hydrolase family 88 protein [Sphingomonas psychrotolerans]
MAALTHDIPRSEITSKIDLLMDNLVNIKDETGEFLLHLEDGRIIDTKGWAGWEWTHGVGLFGMWRYYEQTGDAKALGIIKQWFEDRFAEGTPTKNINTMAPFITLAYLYEHEPDPRYIPYLDTWAEWLMAPDGLPKTEEGGFQHIVFNDENPGEMWDDTLMMSVLPLAKIGLLLGRPHYIEEARRQFLVHIKYLFDKKTGLWFHGWDFNGRHNFAEALWARGNCWVTIAIPEIIEILDLPPGDAFRTFLIDTLAAQVKTLAETQDSGTGLWHTLIVDPSSYLEASATAGFAYGILKAVRKGYLPRHYEAVGIKAVKGVLANIDATGELQQVSFGTAMGDTLQFYKDIRLTSMPYGQSLAICALGEFLRTYI